jgi:hypothetical protein
MNADGAKGGLVVIAFVRPLRDRRITMLELRPTCENCNVPLPPDSTVARICSFECTFCAACVESVLSNVCPNCGGGFAPRPIRPATSWKGENCLATHPPSATAHHRPVDAHEHARFAEPIRAIAPEKR